MFDDVAESTLRSFTDYDQVRKNIFSAAIKGLKHKFPVENDRFRLELSDLSYPEKQSFSISEQKKALLSGRSISVPLTGTWSLFDKTTGELVDQKKSRVMSVPYYTSRGTVIFNGNEYTIANQSRLKPGVYTRVKANADVESHFNYMPGKGASFRILMDPKTSQFRMEAGHAKISLYPILKDMGVTDEQLTKLWGRDILARNMEKANYQDVKKAKEKLEWAAKIPSDSIKDILEGFELDEEVTQTTLGQPFKSTTPESILAATQRILGISRGEQEEDDRDHLAFQRLYSPEDFIQERIQKDAGGIIKKILWDSTFKGNLDGLKPGQLSQQINSILLGSGLGFPPEEINILELLDGHHRVIRMGEGGIESSNAIPDSSRDVHSSQFGFIDAVKAPESGKIGVDSRLSYMAKKGKNGKIYAPMINVKNNKIEWVSPENTLNAVIAFPGEMEKPGTIVAAMNRGKMDYVDKKEVDYTLQSANQMFTANINLIPMVSGAQVMRVLMGSKYLNQAMALKEPEAPLVQVGTPDNPEESFEDRFGKQIAAITAKEGGVVSSVTPEKIVIKTRSGDKEYELYDNFNFNQKSLLSSTPLVKVGEQITQGQVLAKTNYSDNKGTLALGSNLRVGFLAYKGYNYEDGIVISEEAAKKLTTEHMYRHSMGKEEGEVDKNKFTSIFPTIYNAEQTSTIDKNGLAKPGTVVKHGDPLMLAVSSRSEEGKAVHKSYKSAFMNQSIEWDHQLPGVVTDAIIGKGGQKTVVVKSFMPVREADKLAARHGNKGVVAKIVSTNKMPRDSQGRPLHILLNPMGIITRGNPAQVIEAQLGKVADKLGRPFKLPFNLPEGETWVDYAQKQLKTVGLKATEDLYDPESGRKISDVLTGKMFIMRLHHLGESKASGRDTDMYTSEGIPARGGPTGCFIGSQKILTINGPVAISKICEKRLSTQVLTYSENVKDWVYRPVTDWFTYKVPIEDIIEISLDNNQNIICTKNHLLFLSSGEKVLAEDIKISDKLKGYYSPTKVTNISEADKKLADEQNEILVYDITVDDTHSYVTAGTLVSNSKRLGLLDVFALASHGATEVLKDMKMIRGQRNDEFWRAFKMGYTPDSPEIPLIYKKFVSYLKGAGINVERKGNYLNIMAMTDKDITALSRGEIQNAKTVARKDMAPLTGGLFDSLATGGVGGNRWSHIKLAEPLPNPVMLDSIRSLLNITKSQIQDIISGKEKLQGETGGKALKSALSRLDINRELESTKQLLSSQSASKRDDAVKRMKFLQMFKNNGMNPSDLVWSKLPVIPPIFRPITTLGKSQLVADANLLYQEVISANQNLNQLRGRVPEDFLQKEKETLWQSVQAVAGLGEPVSYQLKTKQIKGLLRHVFGTNPKLGMVQSKLIGTAVDVVGRSAITPDPNLNMDQVGLPEETAWRIYRPFITRRLIRSGTSAANAIRMISQKTPEARQALIDELDERPVIVNRAPTLHKFGLLGAWANLVPGNTLKVSPLTTSGYGADFDGDEQHCILMLNSLDNDLEKWYSILSDDEAKYWRKFMEDRKMSARFNVCLPYVEGGNYYVVNLEDFPYQKDKLIGKKDHIEFYEAVPYFKTVVVNEKTGKLELADISGWSIHKDREMWIVNLHNKQQILTDDDERAVYGILPGTLEWARRRPKESEGMLVPVIKDMSDLAYKHENFKTVPSTGGRMIDGNIDLNKELGYIIGALIGDGWVDRNSTKTGYVAINLAGIEKSVVKQYKEFISKLFKEPPHFGFNKSLKSYGESEKHILASVDCANFIAPLIGSGAKNKHLPAFWFGAPRDFKLGLLSGLLDTDGSICITNGKAKPQLQANISSISLRLLQECQQLFLSLGIHSRISFSKKTSTGNDFWILCPSSVELYKLKDELILAHEENISALNTCQPNEESSAYVKNDIIPIDENNRQILSKKLLDKKLMTLYSAVRKGKSFITRICAKKALEQVGEEDLSQEWINIVKAEEITWSYVKSVENTGIKETGYDLTVPGYETFCDIQGIILSNTMNYHVPVSDKAVKEVIEKMMPSKNLFALSDYDVHYLPGQEFTYGLWQASKDHKDKRILKYATKQDAIQAYNRGEIGPGQKVQILNGK